MKWSARRGRGMVLMPTRRSATPQKAVHHGMWPVLCRPTWVNSSMEAVVRKVMPTTPTPRAIMADLRDDQSEAAWNSRRWVSNKMSTARASNDSSMSAPAMMWRTIVPARRTTDTLQDRRCPRRMPRPKATRTRPAMAMRAPAASLARRGRNSSTTWSRPLRGGVMASRRSTIPASRMAADAHRLTRRVRRWLWVKSGAGGHESPIG